MRRTARIVPAAALALAAIIVAALALWPLASTRGFYTDGQGIHEPASNSRPRDILWQTPTPLAETINTPGEEYEPRLGADGRTLYFVRGRAGHNADLYFASRTPNGWSDPQPLAAINTPHDELGPEPLADGSGILFYSDRPNGHGGYDLWIARRDGDAWAEPVNLGDLVNSPFNEYSPALSHDQRTLYFASNRPRPGEPAERSIPAWPATIRENFVGHDYDLYSAPFAETPTEPARPIHALNTSANEGTPAASPAGDFLYFSSDRAGGLGGLDLYRSRILRGQFQKPENLAHPVNSPHHELDPALGMGGFALDFSSNRPLDSAEFTGDYNLFHSESREVILEREPRDIDWAGLWSALWPWLLWLLLALLLLLLLFLVRETLRNKRLSTLAKCLIASGIAHIIILFLLTLWGVSNSIGELFRKPGGAKVHLTSSEPGADPLATQIRGYSTRPELVSPTAAQPIAPAIPAPSPAPSPPMPELASSQAPDAAVPQPQTFPATDTPPLPPTLALAEAPSPASAALTTPAPPQAQSIQEQHARDLNPEQARTAPPQLQLPPLPSQPTTLTPDTTILPDSIATQLSPQPEPRAATPPLPPQAAAIEPPATPLAQLPTPALPSPDTTSETRQSAAQPLTTSQARPLPLPITPHPSSSPAPAAPSTTLHPQPIPPATTLSINNLNTTPIQPPRAETPAPPALEIALAAPSETAPSNHPTSEPAIPSTKVATITPSAPPTHSPSVAQSGTPQLNPSHVADSPLSLARTKPHSPPPDRPVLDAAANLPSPIATSIALPGEQPTPQPAAQAPQDLEPAMRPSAITPLELAATPAPLPLPLPPTNTSLPAGNTTPHSNAAPTDAPAFDLKLVPRPSFSDTPVALSLKDPPPPSAAVDLNLPSETLPLPASPESPYAQRAPEVRDRILEERGGDEETEAAVRRALAWLANHQAADGRWSSRDFDEGCGRCSGRATVDSDIATTGLALLCFYGADHTHAKDGPYRDKAARALEWLLQRQSQDGDLRGGESMYTHAIAAIALAEAYGMTGDPRLRDPVAKAVRFIADARSPRGGWRYEPGQFGDTSVLGWQVMALVSAGRGGIEIPEDALAAAASWLDSVSRRSPGVYSYQPNDAPTASMTAEALFCRQLLGDARESRRTAASIDFLRDHQPRWGRRSTTYYWYYATLAFFQHGGDEWDRWNAAVKRELIANQAKDGPQSGSWAPVDRHAAVGGRVYQTAICTLTLEVYYRYLPMYAAGNAAQPAGP